MEEINEYLRNKMGSIMETGFDKSILGTDSSQPKENPSLTIDKMLEAIEKVDPFYGYEFVLIIEDIPGVGLLNVHGNDLMDHLEDWDGLGYEKNLFKIKKQNFLKDLIRPFDFDWRK